MNPSAPHPTLVYDQEGAPALLVGADDDQVLVRVASGAVLSLPADLVTESAPGRGTADVSFAALEPGTSATFYEIDERLRVDRLERETGRVQVHVRTETRQEPVEASTWRDTVEVERIPVGQVVDTVAAPRTEGDATVIPVYEEVLVVEKRLLLREEVWLRTRREATPVAQTVTLRRQTVDVERLPGADSNS